MRCREVSLASGLWLSSGQLPKGYEFINVNFQYTLKDELKDLRSRLRKEQEDSYIADVSGPHRLLELAFQQLADNAEMNHRYPEAADFRYSAFDVRRIERSHGLGPWKLDWLQRLISKSRESMGSVFKGIVPWELHWWYWLSSGYGESVGRAFIVFVAMISLFAYGYTKVGFERSDKVLPLSAARSPIDSPVTLDLKGKPLGKIDAALYSAYVSILQKPDAKPLTAAARTLVWFETVLGPAQAALLALAARRRFMS